MQILRTPQDTNTFSRELRLAGKRIGFVPTMGALHDGHLSLVRAARAQCDAVIASIFVNPLQFGPKEDLSRYPRPFERDCELLEREGVIAVFAPSPEVMYPAGAATFVEVEGITNKLEGITRPTHFRGVTTVVSKLFNIVQPDAAFFGQKDAQQAAIIRKMVRDLDIPIEVVICPIIREVDGLAMSSRNAYLAPEDRKAALVLSRALHRIEELSRETFEAKALILAGKEVFDAEPRARLDYLAIVSPDTFDPLDDISAGALVAVAAYVGSTRLIDNLLLASRS